MRRPRDAGLPRGNELSLSHSAASAHVSSGEAYVKSEACGFQLAVAEHRKVTGRHGRMNCVSVAERIFVLAVGLVLMAQTTDPPRDDASPAPRANPAFDTERASPFEELNEPPFGKQGTIIKGFSFGSKSPKFDGRSRAKIK
jgi:hypothetical protein